MDYKKIYYRLRFEFIVFMDKVYWYPIIFIAYICIQFMKLKHYIKVALHFNIFQHEFYLALCHDLVEDGYLPNFVCKYWKALNAITRRSNEQYFDYFLRVKRNKTAKNVKLKDLHENMLRCNDSLKKRYIKATTLLTT